MDNNALVSVVIPTVGRVEYLDFSIESILSQTVMFSEVVVFDNSHLQNIKEQSKYGKSKLIKWCKSGEGLDPISSWNKAVSLCSSEFVTIFGDDDVAESELHANIQALINDKSDFIIIPFSKINSIGVEVYTITKHVNVIDSRDFRWKRINREFDLMLPGVIFRKELFEKVGGFVDSGFPGYAYSDDLLWFKISFLSRNITYSKYKGWRYRVHDAQVGNVGDIACYFKASERYIRTLISELVRLGECKNSVLPTGYDKETYADKINSQWFVNRMIGSNFCLKIKQVNQLLESDLNKRKKILLAAKAVYACFLLVPLKRVIRTVYTIYKKIRS